MPTQRPFQILIIEDNEADQSLFKFMISNSAFPCEIHVASNGVEGSDFVFRRGNFAEAPVADLILMDLNIPLKDGRELIKEFKADKTTCKTPIIMISTSSSEKEVSDAYALGATAFISKPVNIDKFQNTINTLLNFWFSCVMLPSRAHRSFL
jgi:chemotaxis family two-component system response regulator Rcp1